jgi:hypothetical protein
MRVDGPPVAMTGGSSAQAVIEESVVSRAGRWWTDLDRGWKATILGLLAVLAAVPL